MSQFRLTGPLALLGFVAAVVPTSAHHALQAVFATTKWVTVKGSISHQDPRVRIEHDQRRVSQSDSPTGFAALS